MPPIHTLSAGCHRGVCIPLPCWSGGNACWSLGAARVANRTNGTGTCAPESPSRLCKLAPHAGYPHRHRRLNSVLALVVLLECASLLHVAVPSLVRRPRPYRDGEGTATFLNSEDQQLPGHSPVGQPPHVGDCRAIAYSTNAKNYEGYVNWCLNWIDAHPNSQCTGTVLPCGNTCFRPFLGQGCENDKVIACTPDGQRRLRCTGATMPRKPVFFKDGKNDADRQYDGSVCGMAEFNGELKGKTWIDCMVQKGWQVR